MNNEREGMFDSGRRDSLNIRSIQVCILNVIKKSITPVEFVSLVINTQSIWPSKKDSPEDHDSCSIEMCSRDICRSIPFREEDVSSVGMNDDCSGSLQVLK